MYSLRREISLLILLIFALCTFCLNPGEVLAKPQPLKPLTDIKGHWAYGSIYKWYHNYLTSGYEDGTFKPEQEISRAEFITLINRVFKISRTSHKYYTDVTMYDWFSKEINKASKAEYLLDEVDGKIYPNKSITRQEVAVILAKYLNLASDKRRSSLADRFKDKDSMNEKYKEAISQVVDKGYIKGYPDKTFRPNQVVTRAEAIAILDRVVGTRYYNSGTHGSSSSDKKKLQEIKGNITVVAPDTTLQNIDMEGNIILAEGIGNGKVTLKNIKLKGDVLVRGVGESKLRIEDCAFDNLIVKNVNNPMDIEVRGKTTIKNTILNSKTSLSTNDKRGKGYKDIVVNAPEEIVLKGQFGTVEVKNNAKLVAEEGKVSKLEIYSKSDISGKADIRRATVYADDVYIYSEIKDLRVEGDKDVYIFNTKYGEGKHRIKYEEEDRDKRKKDEDKDKEKDEELKKPNDLIKENYTNVSTEEELIKAVKEGVNNITLKNSINLSKELFLNRAVVLDGKKNTLTGSVKIDHPGVYLKDLVITGDLKTTENIVNSNLTLADVSILDDVSLENDGKVILKGETIIKDTLNLNNNDLELYIEGKKVRIKGYVYIKRPVVIEGIEDADDTFNKSLEVIEDYKGKDPIVLDIPLNRDAKLIINDEVEELKIYKDIEKLIINEPIEEMTIAEDIEVDLVEAHDKVSVEGKGVINNLYVYSEGVEVKEAPKYVRFRDDVSIKVGSREYNDQDEDNKRAKTKEELDELIIKERISRMVDKIKDQLKRYESSNYLLKRLKEEAEKELKYCERKDSDNSSLSKLEKAIEDIKEQINENN